jgi:hypothetical protein
MLRRSLFAALQGQNASRVKRVGIGVLVVLRSSTSRRVHPRRPRPAPSPPKRNALVAEVGLAPLTFTVNHYNKKFEHFFRGGFGGEDLGRVAARDQVSCLGRMPPDQHVD